MIYEVKGNINSHLFKFPWRSLSVGYKSMVFYGNVIHNIKYSFLTDGLLQDIRFKTQFCGTALVKKSACFLLRRPALQARVTLSGSPFNSSYLRRFNKPFQMCNFALRFIKFL